MNSRPFSLFEASIKSQKTKEVYVYSLHEFMRFAKIKKYDDILKFKSAGIQKLLENWVLHLKDNNKKGKTIKAKLCAVELFLEMNRIIFYKKILHKLIPSNDYIPGGDIPFTTEEIKMMLDATTKLRTKALIHFVASTGVRPASIADPVLELKHIEDMPHGCKAVKIYDGSKEGYWAFLTPEASKALDNYLSSRERNGEKLSPNSPVFSNFKKNTYGKNNEHLSAKSLRQIVSNVISVGGIKRTKKGARYDKAVIYGFRKRFNTILKLNNDVNSNIAEKLMAHTRGLDGTYLTPTREECFNEFIKAIPELTISDEARDKLKITQLQKQVISIEDLKSYLSDFASDVEKEFKEIAGQQAADLRLLTRYIQKDVFGRDPDRNLKEIRKSKRAREQLTADGLPKPSEMSEERLQKIMKDKQIIANTLRKIAKNA